MTSSAIATMVAGIRPYARLRVALVAAFVLLLPLSAIAKQSDFTIRICTREGTLLRSPSLDGEVIVTAEEGDYFTAVTTVNDFYLVKELETESWLYVPFSQAEELSDEVPDNIVFAWQMSMPTSVDLAEWQVAPGMELEDKEVYKLRGTGNDGMLVASNGKKYPANYEYNIDYIPRVDGRRLVEDAYEYMGAKYVLGGTSKTGIDCSGLTQVCLANQGIDVVHRSSLQALHGRYVNYDELQAGDLVFFRDKTDNRYLSHVGIYIGRGKFIHASQSLGGVTITSLNDKYFKSHYGFARRL